MEGQGRRRLCWVRFSGWAPGPGGGDGGGGIGVGVGGSGTGTGWRAGGGVVSVPAGSGLPLQASVAPHRLQVKQITDKMLRRLNRLPLNTTVGP